MLLWALADLLYEGVRGLVEGRADVALANGRAVASLEQSLGVFWEPHLQHLVLGHSELVEFANWTYLNAQFTVNLLFLVLIYCYRNSIFYFVRNMFFVAMGIALTVHLLVPVAPPRMLPQYGFVDSIHQLAHINQDSGAVSMFVNPYAAVPSMHMCFSLLVGVTAYRIARGPLLKLAAVIYPVLVLAVIVVTANHFILDAVAGALCALVAALAAQRVMARARPQAWSWGQRAPAAAAAAGSAAPAKI
ncbi:MAG: hypothetical protein NVSMB51_11700 [Solirubrobacteraceae bacterium]